MSKEYIERGALLKSIRKQCHECDARFEDRICQSCRVRDDIGTIKETPAADVVEVKHGRWEEIRNNYGELEGWIHMDCGREVKAKENYCPNCGARMDGGADNG